MFEFQNLEVYTKAKAFHIACKNIIAKNKLDNRQLDINFATIWIRDKIKKNLKWLHHW